MRPELASDATHLLEQPAHDILKFGELVPAVIGDGIGHGGQPEKDTRQALADLVVQTLRDTEALGLLRVKRASPARHSLVFEAVEHLVEGNDQFGKFSTSRRR